MRKLVAFPVAAILALLAVAGIAFAQAQVNTYSVSGSVSGGKGSKSKPVPVSVKFGYQVAEATGKRPSPVKRYTIDLYGVRSVNGASFPSCSAAFINAEKSDSKCEDGSVVGSGTIKNNAGATNNTADKSIPCNLKLRVHNSGTKKGALFIFGSPPACAINVAQAIPVKYVTGSGGGTALQFDVPAGLLHPIPGVDNAVVDVESSIKKLTTKKRGKTIGYFESVGCKGSLRPIRVKFTPENGAAKSASKNKKC